MWKITAPGHEIFESQFCVEVIDFAKINVESITYMLNDWVNLYTKKNITPYIIAIGVKQKVGTTLHTRLDVSGFFSKSIARRG